MLVNMTYSVNAVEKNIYKNENHSLSMAEAMKILPDAVFYKIWAVLGDKEIKHYLFDRHFEVTDIKKCMKAMPNHDSQNDCCIGNNQQILDALSPHKSYADCMKDMFNIMDAFFTVPSKKIRGHIPPDIIFLPLEQMMREHLYQSLDEFSQQNLLRSWTMHLKATSENYLPKITFQDCLPSQQTVKTEPNRMKLKPGIDHNYSLFQHLTHLTMTNWTNTDGLKDLPIIPSDFEYPPLENNMGEGEPLGPLLHSTGLLPIVLKIYPKFPDCPLRNKYREYPQASWPHAFSCSNKCQNQFSQQVREDKCSSIIYIADSDMTADQCKEFILVGSKISQIYISWTAMRTISIFSLYLIRK